jgi:cytochrome c-type biogenesis protein CcmE
MKPKHKRLSFLAAGLVLLGGAVALALVALQDNITFFYTPAQIAEGEVEPGQRIRLGGFVLENSVRRVEDGSTVEFTLEDQGQQVAVRYRGILPDLFREGQGAVVTGRLQQNGVFAAEEVLARHDENYIPRELEDQLRDRGMLHGRQQGERQPAYPGRDTSGD